MKKSFFVLMLAAGFIANVNATDNAGTVISSGTPIPVDNTGCSLLSESVSINTSTGVFGAYACNTTDNIIAVSTCHPNGRKGTVTVSCTVGAAGQPADCAQPTGSTCVPDATATPAVTCPGTGTVLGGVTNVATTAGGRVGGVAAANCVTGGSTTAEAATAAEL